MTHETIEKILVENTNFSMDEIGILVKTFKKLLLSEIDVLKFVNYVNIN